MKTFEFAMRISAESWLDFYKRPNSTVVATDRTGRRIKLAARHFQKFVTRDGVSGLFVLTLADNNDFVSLERMQ